MSPMSGDSHASWMAASELPDDDREDFVGDQKTTCAICGGPEVLAEAGLLCVAGCRDAELDAVEAFYDLVQPDGRPAHTDDKLRAALRAFWKTRVGVSR